jgi:hypothetical protein
MAFVRRVWAAYEARLSAHPIPTQMATSAMLWGLGDAMAQSIERYEAATYGRAAGGGGHGAQAPAGTQGGQQQQQQQRRQQHPQPSAGATAAQALRQQQHLSAAAAAAHAAAQQAHPHTGSSTSSGMKLDARRLALTAAFGCGFIGPVGHAW